MSPQQPSPLVFPENVKRPGTVVVTAILVFIVGLLNLAATAGALFLAMRPGEQQTFVGAPTSDLFWYFTALMSFILFLIYMWLGRGQLKGVAQAWVLVNVLMVINIIFALFQIFYGTGFATIIFCVIVLLLNNAGNAKAYFMSNLPPEVKAQMIALQEQQAAAAAAAAAVAARQAAEAQQAATPPAASTPPSTPPTS